jgi:phage-related protein
MIESIKPEEFILYLRKSRTDDPALSVSETVAKHEQMRIGEFLKAAEIVKAFRTWTHTATSRKIIRTTTCGVTARQNIGK